MKLKNLLAAAFVAAMLPSVAQAQTSANWTVSGSWGADGYRRAGDFNGDGKTDIIAPYGTDAYLRRSTGSGFVFETWTMDNGSFLNNGANVLVGDFNCDGRDDLAVANVYSNTPTGNIKVKYNRTSPGDSSPYSFTTSEVHVLPGGAQVWAFGDVSMTKVGDYDGDGCRDDIASPVPGSSLIRLFTYAPSGVTPGGVAFYSNEITGAGSWNGANWTFGGDFDCDGRDDLASANGTSVYMKLNTSSGWNFTTWTAPGVWGTTGYPRSMQGSSQCAASLASPKTGVGTMYFKANDTPDFIDNTFSVSSDWGSAGLTFSGDFDGNGMADIASSPGNSNIYMKLF